jgi:hypothetical protein
MDLRKEFEKEKGYDCYAYRQDYAGAHQYQDGFSDDYVEWLESKVNNVALDDVIVKFNCLNENIKGNKFRCKEHCGTCNK